MYTNDFMDQPDDRKGKGVESRGTFIFKNGLKGTKLDFIRPQKDDQTVVRLIGVPDTAKKDVVPFLQPRPTLPMSEQVQKLFWLTNAYEINVVDFVGPQQPKKEKDDDTPRIPLVAMVDDYPPAMKRKAMQDNRRLPPTCFDILNSRAASVAAMNPGRFGKYYKDPNNDYHNALKKAKRVMFITGLALNHGYLECSPESPVPVVVQLGWTALSNLKVKVFTEREGYVYPEGATHDLIATRGELAKRFVVPDLVNPVGAPAIIIKSQPQKRRSDKAMGGGSKGEMRGNEYVVSLTDVSYPVPVELQQELYVPPEDLFWYPTPQEAFEVLLNNASERDWIDFLMACAKGTDIEAKSRFTPGVEVEEQSSGEEVAEERHVEARVVQEALPVSSPPVAAPLSVAPPLALGAGKPAESSAYTMPMPGAVAPLQVKAAGAPEGAADIAARVEATRLKLQQMRS